ncbi:MAG TPA: type II toxin-antitoxin system RelE/ParE family toxin, partial [Acetobacteraceae bacterium]|nr:type II toxin-antitoxin system RelE/ParE family toxin [Acetobacteraceae bacterium]
RLETSLILRVIWSDPALAAIERVHQRIAAESLDATVRVAHALLEAGNSLGHLPYRGRPVPGTTRRELIAGFDYIIRYRVFSDTVRIERVRHGKRRPTRP